ncbi:MAG: dihydropteroate synthase [Bacteroidales bacterium]|nr:dihydropteroate synthase [Bacteroidales bacterium]
MLSYNDIVMASNPLVMGVLNTTPDSFFDGGRYCEKNAVLQRAKQIIEEGADIIDIGGYSSRPNAEHISVEEEKKRLAPNIELLLKNFPDITISVDTFRAEIADFLAENYNIAIINDISGGELDEKMFETAARLDICYILMHMRGTPKTMQQLNIYNNVTEEVLNYLRERIETLNAMGVKKIIIDPGFGFAKDTEQNYELLKNLRQFAALNYPILAGLSRKSMLYKTLGNTPADCLNATTAANTMALMNGAKILRVHDVKEAKETITIFQKYQGL